MPLKKTAKLPAPRDWDEFESLCADLFQRIWEDPGTQRVGRNGQRQNGVDIVGRPKSGTAYSGVQARNKLQPPETLTAKELNEEVEKAKSFFPRLADFILATTAPNDAVIQEEARRLTAKNLADGGFSVSVLSWDELSRRIAEHDEVLKAYYPQFFEGDRSNQATSRSIELLEEQAKWQEEKDRPRWALLLQGGNHMAATFAPEFKLQHVSGDKVAHVEWRFRGPRFLMPEWRAIGFGLLDRMLVTHTFNLMSEPLQDELVEEDEMGVDVRFHWHGAMRHEIHRWPIQRTQHPTKVAFEILDEIIPSICFDEADPP